MIHTISILGTLHYAYDVTMDRWIERAQASLARHYRSGMGLAPDGRIFLLGSEFPNSSVGSGEVASAYDPATNTWMQLPAMPSPRTDGAVTGAHGLVYAVGNAHPDSWSLNMDVFDPASNTWLPAITTPRQVLGFASAVTSKDGTMIYVIDSTTRFDIYDIAKKEWIRGPDHKTDALSGFVLLQQGAVVASDGRLFVIGGVRAPLAGNPKTFVPSRFVEVYDPKRNTWIAGQP